MDSVRLVLARLWVQSPVTARRSGADPPVNNCRTSPRCNGYLAIGDDDGDDDDDCRLLTAELN